jgi:hypothetical protein
MKRCIKTFISLFHPHAPLRWQPVCSCCLLASCRQSARVGRVAAEGLAQVQVQAPARLSSPRPCQFPRPCRRLWSRDLRRRWLPHHPSRQSLWHKTRQRSSSPDRHRRLWQKTWFHRPRRACSGSQVTGAGKLVISFGSVGAGSPCAPDCNGYRSAGKPLGRAGGLCRAIGLRAKPFRCQHHFAPSLKDNT